MTLISRRTLGSAVGGWRPSGDRCMAQRTVQPPSRSTKSTAAATVLDGAMSIAEPTTFCSCWWSMRLRISHRIASVAAIETGRPSRWPVTGTVYIAMRPGMATRIQREAGIVQ